MQFHRALPLLPVLLAHGLFAGCSTYRTYDSQLMGRNGRDQTDGRYGQPYYLPKTLVHLTITPAGKDAGGGKDPAAAANSNTNTNNSAGGTMTVNVYSDGTVTRQEKEKPGEGGPKPSPTPAPTGQVGKPEKPNLSAVTGTQTTPPPAENGGGKSSAPQDNQNPPDKTPPPGAYKYTITVTTETVPDFDTGALYLKQTPNWFYSEETKIAVNDNYLLTTTDTTSSDRTAQVIYNLADTAANLAKAASAYAAVEINKGATGSGRAVKYKTLTVDIKFDPLNPKDIAKLESLFGDTITNKTHYVSPLKVRVKSPIYSKARTPAKFPAKTAGIFFREPVALEIEVSGRQEEYRSAITEEVKKASGDFLAPLQQQLDDAYGSTEHRATVFPVQAMNKNRVFAYDVVRSAFVQNKKHNLTIVDGSLRGVYKLKPSEAEGFSEIPLKLSEKILALPKDLLSFRQDITTKTADNTKAQTNAVNAQSDLISAQQALAKKQAPAQNTSP